MSTVIKYPSYDLDEALRRYREPGTVVEFQKGTYTTRGAWAFLDKDGYNTAGFAPGVRYEFGDADVVLAQPQLHPVNRWVQFPCIGDGATIRGTGAWTFHIPGDFYSAGFEALGSCILDIGELAGLDGRFEGPGGEKEVFAFWQHPGAGGTKVRIGRVHGQMAPVGNCYVSGIYLNDSAAVLDDTRVDMPEAYFALSSAKRATAKNCFLSAKRGIYTDTDNLSLTLKDSRINAGYACVSLVAKEATALTRHVRLVDCILSAPDGRLVEFDRTSGAKQNAVVAAVDCSFATKYRVASADPDAATYLFNCFDANNAADALINQAQPPFVY